MHAPGGPNMGPVKPKASQAHYETREDVRALRERIKDVSGTSFREHRDAWREIRDHLVQQVPYGG